jgi:hypothetical protein
LARALVLLGIYPLDTTNSYGGTLGQRNPTMTAIRRPKESSCYPAVERWMRQHSRCFRSGCNVGLSHSRVDVLGVRKTFSNRYDLSSHRQHKLQAHYGAVVYERAGSLRDRGMGVWIESLAEIPGRRKSTEDGQDRLSGIGGKKRQIGASTALHLQRRSSSLVTRFRSRFQIRALLLMKNAS